MLSILALIVSMEGGFMPDYFTSFGDATYSQQILYTNLSLELEAYDTFFVKYGTRMNSTYLTGVVVVPQNQSYSLSGGFRFMGFEVGANHFCLHPVESLLPDGVHSDMQMFQWTNEVYVKYSAKFKL